MKKYLFHNPVLLFFYSVTAVVAALLGMSFAYVMAALVDLAADLTPERLCRTVVFSLLWLAADILFFFLYQFLQNSCLRGINTALRQDLFERILDQQPAQFAQHTTGSYLADLNNNLQSLESSFFAPILEGVFSLANLLGALVGMLLIHPSTLWLILAMVGVSALIPALAAQYIQRRSQEFLGRQDVYTAKAKEFLDGFGVIRAFAVFPAIRSAHLRYNRQLEEGRKAQRDLNTVTVCAAIFCGLLSTILAMAYGGVLVLQGRAAAGSIVAMGHLIGNLSSVSDTVSGFLSQLNASKPVRERFCQILSTPPSSGERGETLNRVEEIALRDLSFGYGEGPQVLHRLSAVFQPGKAYALVGKSGCGKSTLLALLQGQYREYSGSILLDGRELRDFSPQSLCAGIGLMSQQTFLFDDTIRNNITLYQSFPQEAVERAVEQSGLAPLVRQLPQGLDTPVQEGGDRFSGGERQRIAVARLLLRDCPVLLLDEFTSGLDPQTAALVEGNLLDLPGRTILHATHRLDPQLLGRYDQILVLEEGRIVQQGSYRQLLEQGGYLSPVR